MCIFVQLYVDDIFMQIYANHGMYGSNLIQRSAYYIERLRGVMVILH